MTSWRRLLKSATAVEVLQLRPGDVLAVYVPDGTTQATANALRDALAPRLPVEFLVLPRAISLETIRPPEEGGPT